MRLLKMRKVEEEKEKKVEQEKMVEMKVVEVDKKAPEEEQRDEILKPERIEAVEKSQTTNKILGNTGDSTGDSTGNSTGDMHVVRLPKALIEELAPIVLKTAWGNGITNVQIVPI
jgi:hypothetical protein